MAIHLHLLWKSSLIFFLLLECLGSSSATSSSTHTLYVSPLSDCTRNCGSISSPFVTIEAAVSAARGRSPTNIILLPGLFTGSMNKNIQLSKTVISFMSSAPGVTIDCAGAGLAFQISESSVNLIGMTIRNCNSTNGGAVRVSESSVTFTSVALQNNTAVNGGAVFAEDRSVVALRQVSCEGNKATIGGCISLTGSSRLAMGDSNRIRCNEAISRLGDDVFCSGSSVSVSQGDTSYVTNMGVTCVSCVMPLGLCGQVQTEQCRPVDNQQPTCSSPTSPFPASCGDGVCDSSDESCLSCPADCGSCTFDGVRVDSYSCSPVLRTNSSSCLVSVTAIPAPIIHNFMPTVKCSVSGVLTGYFKVPETAQYEFRLAGTNVGGSVSINNKTLILANLEMEELRTTRPVFLEKDRIHKLLIDFFSFSDKTRSINLSYRVREVGDFATLNTTFISQNVCGDGILDADERNASSPHYCSFDIEAAAETMGTTAAPFCGDGICNEQYPNRCFVDCYNEIASKKCTTRDRRSRLTTVTPVASDTVGQLLNSQNAYILPGSEHLQHGLDVSTGEAARKPVFYFSHCGDTDTVEDAWRGWTYSVPQELIAKPMPRCTLEMASTKFESATVLSSTMAEASKVRGSVSLSGNWAGISVGASLAFANERSVKAARDMTTKRTGSLFMVETECSATQVAMLKHSFHPQFLGDLRLIRSANDAALLMMEYGTHFIHTATLGGRLRQLSSVDESFESGKTSRELAEHAEISFSASISAPVLSASGSYYQSTDSSTTESAQNDFMESSSRSKLIIYGGTPGAFGPSSSVDASYGDWASNVDVRPVPIHYELEPILSIIPLAWKNADGVTIQSLWEAGERIWIQNRTRSVAEVVEEDTASAAKPMERSSFYTLIWAFEGDEVAERRDWVVVVVTDVDTGRQFETVIYENRGPAGTYVPITFYKLDGDARYTLYFPFEGPHFNRFTFHITFKGVSWPNTLSPHAKEYAQTPFAGLIQHSTSRWAWLPRSNLQYALASVPFVEVDATAYYVGFNVFNNQFANGYSFDHTCCGCEQPDLISIIIRGQHGQVSDTVSLASQREFLEWTWGLNYDPRSTLYKVSSQGSYLGKVLSVHLVVGNSIACHWALDSRDPEWKIAQVFVVGPDCDRAPCNAANTVNRAFFGVENDKQLKRSQSALFNMRYA